ncbi:hypothetical protein [Fibrobacter sp. UWB3]|uniref:hypothetical protein n=1 Tax=Fibrobacter sp. UWB3 TaxID=1964357 RepID=UPI0011318A90|nr:hypothetical protein [Fibrobacter sp. UWB3]
MFRSVILGPFARVILNAKREGSCDVLFRSVILNAKREGSSNVLFRVVIPHLLRNHHLVSE